MNENKRIYTISHVDYEVGDGLLIVPVENGVAKTDKSLYLEDTGLQIWELLNEGLSPTEIIEAITKRYAGNNSAIHDDVIDFLNGLIHNGYLSETE